MKQKIYQFYFYLLSVYYDVFCSFTSFFSNYFSYSSAFPLNKVGISAINPSNPNIRIFYNPAPI